MIDHDAVFTTEPKRLGKRIAKFRMQVWERVGLVATKLSIRLEGLSLTTTHRMFEAQDDYYGRSRGRIMLDVSDLLAKRDEEQAAQIAGAMLSELRDVTGPHA